MAKTLDVLTITEDSTIIEKAEAGVLNGHLAIENVALIAYPNDKDKRMDHKEFFFTKRYARYSTNKARFSKIQFR